MPAGRAHESMLSDFCRLKRCFNRFLFVPLCFRRFQSDFNQNLIETTTSARSLRFSLISMISDGFQLKPKPNNDFRPISPISDRFQTDFRPISDRFRLKTSSLSWNRSEIEIEIFDFVEIVFDFFTISISFRFQTDFRPISDRFRLKTSSLSWNLSEIEIEIFDFVEIVFGFFTVSISFRFRRNR